MNDQEIRDRITPGVREYVNDAFDGVAYNTPTELEAHVEGIVEGVIDDLNTPPPDPLDEIAEVVGLNMGRGVVRVDSREGVWQVMRALQLLGYTVTEPNS